jgi:hypothetical protein
VPHDHDGVAFTEMRESSGLEVPSEMPSLMTVYWRNPEVIA